MQNILGAITEYWMFIDISSRKKSERENDFERKCSLMFSVLKIESSHDSLCCLANVMLAFTLSHYSQVFDCTSTAIYIALVVQCPWSIVDILYKLSLHTNTLLKGILPSSCINNLITMH